MSKFTEYLEASRKQNWKSEFSTGKEKDEDVLKYIKFLNSQFNISSMVKEIIEEKETRKRTLVNILKETIFTCFEMAEENGIVSTSKSIPYVDKNNLTETQLKRISEKLLETTPFNKLKDFYNKNK